MKIKYSFVCDAANIAQSGNFNVLGIFQSILATNFPCTHPKMVYVACIEFHRSEAGQHNFKLYFVDEDGKNVIKPIEQPLTTIENQKYANIIVELANIKFNKSGTYAIDLTINNQHIASDNIIVQLIKKPTQQQ